MALIPPFSSFRSVVREKAPFSSLPVIVSLLVRKCLASISNAPAAFGMAEDPALRRSLHVVGRSPFVVWRSLADSWRRSSVAVAAAIAAVSSWWAAYIRMGGQRSPRGQHGCRWPEWAAF